MSQTILRLPTVIKRTGKSRSSVYRDVDLGLLPQPISIGARSIGWPEREIDAVILARIAGVSENEIRALVKRLVAQRSEVAI